MKSFDEVHSTCKTNFRIKIKACQTRFRILTEDQPDKTNCKHNMNTNQPISFQTRRSAYNNYKEKHMCFICNIVRASDENKYKEGGIGRYTNEKLEQSSHNKYTII